MNTQSYFGKLQIGFILQASVIGWLGVFMTRKGVGITWVSLHFTLAPLMMLSLAIATTLIIDSIEEKANSEKNQIIIITLLLLPIVLSLYLILTNNIGFGSMVIQIMYAGYVLYIMRTSQVSKETGHFLKAMLLGIGMLLGSSLNYGIPNLVSLSLFMSLAIFQLAIETREEREMNKMLQLLAFSLLFLVLPWFLPLSNNYLYAIGMGVTTFFMVFLIVFFDSKEKNTLFIVTKFFMFLTIFMGSF